MLKKLMLSGITILSLSTLITENSEARRCRRSNRGNAVAAGIFAGAVAGAVAAGAYDYDYYGPCNPYYVPPRTRVYYPGAPIYAYDYPAASYAPIYSYPYDTMFAPGYYRPIY